MLNREAYKDTLDNLLAGVVAVVYGKPVLCEDANCSDCLLRESCGEKANRKKFIDWLNAEYQEPSVDWSKVPIDTPVLVSDDGEKWHKRYYAGMGDDGDPKVYSFGQTSWSGTDVSRISYEFMKLAEGNE